jgi:histone acetyltransferase
MQMTKPVVEGPLGSPPFERLSISKGVTNFVMFKYSQQIPKVNYYSHPLKHKTKLTI